MLDLRRLVVLREVQRRGTLAAAARALSYSPSAVSQALARLEQEAGTALTEPIGRGIRLTDDALLLVQHAEAAVAELESAESLLAARRGRVTGRLRVATFQTGLLSLIPDALGRLGREHPDLQVEVALRDAGISTGELVAGAVDVVLGEEYPGFPQAPDPRLDRVELGCDDLVLAVPPTGEWAAVRGPADAAEAPWALEPRSSAPGRWAREVCRAAGFAPDVRFDSVDPLMHVRLVQAGHAVSLVPALPGPEGLREVRLVRLAGTPQRRLFTLTRASRAEHPAVIALRETLAAAFAEITRDAIG